MRGWERLGIQNLRSGAFLLTGNDQKRKKEALLSIARLVCCESQGKDSCEMCASCKAVSSFSHPDIRVATDLTMKGLREFRSSLGNGAWISRSTVAIVEGIEKIGESGQSLLLKLLEDPPGNTIFLLTSETPSAVLPTVRSRLQEVPFFRFENIKEAREKLSQDLLKDMASFHSLSFEKRLLYAKNMGEDPERTFTALLTWLAYARIILREQVQDKASVLHLSRTIRIIKLLSRLIALQQSSTTSPRLALERFMVEL
ncbi:MAG: hypothetical protein Q8P70_02075 [bacterium]|nr:hypothetical protein [bacterium]